MGRGSFLFWQRRSNFQGPARNVHQAPYPPLAKLLRLALPLRSGAFPQLRNPLGAYPLQYSPINWGSSFAWPKQGGLLCPCFMHSGIRFSGPGLHSNAQLRAPCRRCVQNRWFLFGFPLKGIPKKRTHTFILVGNPNPQS